MEALESFDNPGQNHTKRAPKSFQKSKPKPLEHLSKIHVMALQRRALKIKAKTLRRVLYKIYQKSSQNLKYILQKSKPWPFQGDFKHILKIQAVDLRKGASKNLLKIQAKT